MLSIIFYCGPAAVRRSSSPHLILEIPGSKPGMGMHVCALHDLHDQKTMLTTCHSLVIIQIRQGKPPMGCRDNMNELCIFLQIYNTLSKLILAVSHFAFNLQGGWSVQFLNVNSRTEELLSIGAQR